MTKLTLQINKNAEEVQKAGDGSNLGRVMITPPINEDYWLIRVPVSEKQAIVGFPKFGTIGIGFQIEEQDWNTNLPYQCDSGAAGIYNHIKHNAKVEGDSQRPSKAVCIRAIQMVIDEAKRLRGA